MDVNILKSNKECKSYYYYISYVGYINNTIQIGYTDMETNYKLNTIENIKAMQNYLKITYPELSDIIITSCIRLKR